MKNKRVSKRQGRILNSLIVLVTAGVIAFTPVLAVSSAALAVPRLPGTPETPDTPDTPDTPELPGDDSGTSDTQPAEESTGGDGEPYDGDYVGDQTASNTDTGQGSDNDASTSTTTDTDATINNDAQVDNQATAASNTGDNNSDANTGDGTVDSGDAGINANYETDLNQVALGNGEYGTGSVSLGELAALNENTGSDSNNDASSENINNTDLAINNNLDVNNSGYFNADSGNNSASKNTGDGEIVAGDADIVLTALNVGNNVNVGTQVFNVYDDQTGDLIIDYDNVGSVPIGYTCSGASENSTTGANSENDASTLCDDSTTIVVDNFGNVVNDYYLSADTGNNTADKNTGDGSIITGDANITVNVINFLNNTFLGGPGELLLGVVNIFGNLNGNILLNLPENGDDVYYSGFQGSADNSNTGADSDNDANVSSTTDTDISLINNAEILNSVMLFGDTGNNTADKNTGSGSITSGDVNSNLNVANIANTNSIGANGTLWMVLINNLGDWTGQIWGFDNSGIASPFYTFSIGENGTFDAVNDTTGADSTNNASADSTTNTDIAINNNASLTNNIYINANTGGNSASMNTGSGNISTGDVNVAANIVNLVNNNFLAGRFVITIVNVFGTWTGSLFPNGDEAPTGGVLADENSSISIGANGVSNNSEQYYAGSYSGSYGTNSSTTGVGDAEEEGIASSLTKIGESVKVDSVTKVIGRDSRSLTDYWWVIIPLFIAIASATYRRRFLWKTQ